VEDRGILLALKIGLSKAVALWEKFTKSQVGGCKGRIQGEKNGRPTAKTKKSNDTTGEEAGSQY